MISRMKRHLKVGYLRINPVSFNIFVTELTENVALMIKRILIKRLICYMTILISQKKVKIKKNMEPT